MAKEKHPGGRPSKYKPEYRIAAEFMARLGATDKIMADKFGISEATLNTWKEKHPEFLESLKRGKEEPDDKVERSLFELATGFEHEVEKPLIVSDGAQIGSHVEIVKHREKLAPNVTAQIFWLKNRRPDRWRDGSTNLNLNLNKDSGEMTSDEEKLYQEQLKAIKGEK